MEQRRLGSVFGPESSLMLKGIAIVMMIAHHCFRSPSLYKGYNVIFAPFAEQQVIKAASVCKICVSLFAFISGYGLFLSHKKHRGTATSWAIQRYVKTFSGFWFIWVLSAVICQLINGRTVKVLFKEGFGRGIMHSLIDCIGLAKLFDTPTLNGTWWYMSAAAFFILLLPILFHFRNDLGLCFALWVFLLRIIFGHNGKDVFPGNNSIYPFVGIFILGCVFAQYDLFDKWIRLTQAKPVVKAIKLIAELCLLFLCFRLYSMLPLNLLCEFHFALFPLLFILFCVEFILPIPFLKRPLSFLGRHSMNVFLTHTFFRVYYLKDFTYSRGHFIMIILVLLGISLLLSVILEWIKKLLRYECWFHRPNRSSSD